MGPAGGMLCFRRLPGKFEFLFIDLTSTRIPWPETIRPRRRIDGWVIGSKTPVDDCWHPTNLLPVNYFSIRWGLWLFINSGVTRKQRASEHDELRTKPRCGPVSLCVFKRNQVKFSNCAILPVRVTVVIGGCPALRICGPLARHPFSKELYVIPSLDTGQGSKGKFSFSSLML